MLAMAKQLLHESINNETLEKSRRSGIRIAAGYLIDNVENTLIQKWCDKNEVQLTDTNSDFVTVEFQKHFCYDVNDTYEKRVARLEEIQQELI